MFKPSEVLPYPEMFTLARTNVFCVSSWVLSSWPSRVTSASLRGPGAAAERKCENEAMRRVKQLPKLTERLYEQLGEGEACGLTTKQKTSEQG